ncbi:MAG: hypothetical protein AB1454_02175 [Candidatus Auribacterota bacterium]
MNRAEIATASSRLRNDPLGKIRVQEISGGASRTAFVTAMTFFCGFISDPSFAQKKRAEPHGTARCKLSY